MGSPTRVEAREADPLTVDLGDLVPSERRSWNPFDAVVVLLLEVEPIPQPLNGSVEASRVVEQLIRVFRAGKALDVASLAPLIHSSAVNVVVPRNKKDSLAAQPQTFLHRIE